MRKLQRELQRQFPGARIEVTGSNHYRIELPNGRVVFAPSTPSDRRGRHNLRATVRRELRNDEQQEE